MFTSYHRHHHHHHTNKLFTFVEIFFFFFLREKFDIQNFAAAVMENFVLKGEGGQFDAQLYSAMKVAITSCIQFLSNFQQLNTLFEFLISTFSSFS
jgi:hypothetical protein